MWKISVESFINSILFPTLHSMPDTVILILQVSGMSKDQEKAMRDLRKENRQLLDKMDSMEEKLTETKQKVIVSVCHHLICYMYRFDGDKTKGNCVCLSVCPILFVTCRGLVETKQKVIMSCLYVTILFLTCTDLVETKQKVIVSVCLFHLIFYTYRFGGDQTKFLDTMFRTR